MYKLLVLDIDGTLINNHMQVSKATAMAIKAAQRQDVFVTLATGRSFYSALNYARRLNIDLPLICANGGIVRKPSGEIISEETLPPALAADLLAKMSKARLIAQAYHRDGIAFYGDKLPLKRWVSVVAKRFSLASFFYAYQDLKRSRLLSLPNLEELVRAGKIEPHKLFAVGDVDALEDMSRRCQQENLSVEHYPGHHGGMYLEIMAAGSSKGQALKKLAHHLNVDMQDVLAIGDNLNDTEMIASAGLGVAMGNGHQGLKDVASHVTLSNEEDGVAAVIREFILCPGRSAS